MLVFPSFQQETKLKAAENTQYLNVSPISYIENENVFLIVITRPNSTERRRSWWSVREI
jgi:hypothetical protein